MKRETETSCNESYLIFVNFDRKKLISFLMANVQLIDDGDDYALIIFWDILVIRSCVLEISRKHFHMLHAINPLKFCSILFGISS